MHTLGEYVGAQRTLDGELCLMFAVDEDPENIVNIEKLKGSKIVLDVKKYSEKRSLNANAYFWKLCDLIAKKISTDKDTVYLMELRDHGVFEAIDVIDKAVEVIRPLYRYIEEDHRYSSIVMKADGEEDQIEMVSLICYRGSHEYDSKEMSDLIDGTVNDARELGIDTWTDAEIENLVSRWERR